MIARCLDGVNLSILVRPAKGMATRILGLPLNSKRNSSKHAKEEEICASHQSILIGSEFKAKIIDYYKRRKPIDETTERLINHMITPKTDSPTLKETNI